jgi:hypothetical protein
VLYARLTSPRPRLHAPADLLEVERHANFVLCALAKAVLVIHPAFNGVWVARHRVDGEHRLIFRKGFLRKERTRKIQIAARPARVGAKGMQVLNDPVDLSIREDVVERRHDVAFSSHSSAQMDDCEPDEIGLRRRDGAVGEVRKRCRRLEAKDRLRLAFAVRGMARGAGCSINLFAAPLRLRLKILPSARAPTRGQPARQAMRRTGLAYNPPAFGDDVSRRSAGRAMLQES